MPGGWYDGEEGRTLAQASAPSLLEEYLRGRIVWLVRLRWVAALAVVVAAGVSAALDVLAAPVLLLFGPLFLVAGNVIVVRALRVDAGWSAPEPGRRLRFYERLIFGQILVDLAALTLVLQLSGGPENPFSMLYVFLAAEAGMLLPLRLALVASGASCLFHGVGVLGELWGLLPHMPLAIGTHHEIEELAGGSLWASPLFSVAYMCAFVLTQLGVTWFFRQVAERYRDAEERRRRQEVVAVGRERLARVGALAAGVAHTVRNPLHGLMNGVDILRRSVPGDHDTVELLDVMEEGIDRIATMTSRLLTLTGSDAPAREPTDVSALVEDALRFVKLRSRELGVHVHVDVRCEAVASVDAALLSEALANVVDNAVYVSAPGSSVEVRVLPAGPHVAIEVEDAGPGIDEASLAQVFDPFFTTKPIGEGTGLGLAIARRAVEDHGGTITIWSRPGEGTRVTIELQREDRT